MIIVTDLDITRRSSVPFLLSKLVPDFSSRGQHAPGASATCPSRTLTTIASMKIVPLRNRATGEKQAAMASVHVGGYDGQGDRGVPAGAAVARAGSDLAGAVAGDAEPGADDGLRRVPDGQAAG
jgi:hypothetical protein